MVADRFSSPGDSPETIYSLGTSIPWEPFVLWELFVH